MIHKIEADKIKLSFNWQEKEKKSDIPIFNYVLELDSDYTFDFNFLVNSSYQSKKYKNDYFKKGLSKNEEELENETIVSISNQFFLNNKQYIQLTINPVQYVNDIYDLNIKRRLY